MNQELINILKDKNKTFYERSIIYEKFNMEQQNGKSEAAYYTKQEIVKKMCEQLPDFENVDEITILEPSVGSGNFIPELINRYPNKKLNLILNDISDNSLNYLKIFITAYINEKNIKNVNITYSCGDFMDFDFSKYKKNIDIIIGNPPYFTIKNKTYLQKLKKEYKEKTNNIFAFFIRKSINNAKYVSFIIPKGIMFAANYKETRKVIENNVTNIIDYKNKAFNVNLETISILIETKPKDNKITIIDYLKNDKQTHDRNYLLNPEFPIWLIYRNSFFDKVLSKIVLGSFDVYRDRQITNKMLNNKKQGLRVIRGRNLTKDKIIDIENYDKYTTETNLNVLKKINQARDLGKDILIAPNLTSKPRFLKLPENHIVNGSVALLIPKNDIKINIKDINFLNSQEFIDYYDIIRNKSNLTINLDNYIGYFIGKLK